MQWFDNGKTPIIDIQWFSFYPLLLILCLWYTHPKFAMDSIEQENACELFRRTTKTLGIKLKKLKKSFDNSVVRLKLNYECQWANQIGTTNNHIHHWASRGILLLRSRGRGRLFQLDIKYSILKKKYYIKWITISIGYKIYTLY